MPNICLNYLIVTGERVKEFADEFIDEDEGIIKIYDYEEDEEVLVEIHGWDLGKDKILLEFGTSWSPPTHWLIDVAQRYKDLQFELRYAEGNIDFSGYIKIENGYVLLDEEGRCGLYYGYSSCEYCEDDIQYCDEFDIKYWCCEDCLININTARDTISKHILKKKIKKVNESIALKRMGRNPIMDNYLMRKVFIKRLSLE